MNSKSSYDNKIGIVNQYTNILTCHSGPLFSNIIKFLIIYISRFLHRKNDRGDSHANFYYFILNPLEFKFEFDNIEKNCT